MLLGFYLLLLDQLYIFQIKKQTGALENMGEQIYLGHQGNFGWAS